MPLFHMYFLKSAKSISNPAMNMIYKSPTVPKRTILLSLAIRFSPKGPTTTPAMINPIRCGMRILFNNIGENRMINKMSEKINTGLLSGKLNSRIRKSIILLILLLFYYFLVNNFAMFLPISSSFSIGPANEGLFKSTASL